MCMKDNYTLKGGKDNLGGPRDEEPHKSSAWVELICKEIDKAEGCYRSKPPIQSSEDEKLHPHDRVWLKHKAHPLNLLKFIHKYI